MDKRSLKQLTTYLVITYLCTLLLSLLSLFTAGGKVNMIASGTTVVIIAFFIWGATRIYTKESRGWFKTLRFFFFFGVFFLLLNSLGMLYGAIKNPMNVFDQIAMLYYPGIEVSFKGAITMQKALTSWGLMTNLTLIPLIPIWFLFSNAGKYFKEKNG